MVLIIYHNRGSKTVEVGTIFIISIVDVVLHHQEQSGEVHCIIPHRCECLIKIAVIVSEIKLVVELRNLMVYVFLLHIVRLNIIANPTNRREKPVPKVIVQ